MFQNYFGFDAFINTRIILFFLLASLIGAYIRFILIFFANQKELKNLRAFMAFIMLPPIGYLITNVISTNIALSLGMVGALSIVRFRTPVKNPLELINYFLLITIGIVLNVEPNFALNFCLYLGTTLMIFKIFNLYFNDKTIYKELFENNSEIMYSLSIYLKKDKVKSGFNKYLKHNSYDGEIYLYIYSTLSKEKLDEIFKSFDQSDVIKYTFDY